MLATDVPAHFIRSQSHLYISAVAPPGEDKITEVILTGAKPGVIVLCHDRHAQAANCIGRILNGLKEREFNLVTISALLDHLHPVQLD